MDIREKLVEIVCDAMEADGCIGHCNHPPCFAVERVVNALITHGVTVQEWISVKDRLPQEDEPEKALCEQVQVLLDNGFVSTGWCNRYFKMWWHLNPGETDFISFDYEHTPVIAWQPLTQPPKGETIYCKDCENLMFSDCYGECKKGYKGIVNPNDTCEHATRKPPKGE